MGNLLHYAIVFLVVALSRGTLRLWRRRRHGDGRCSLTVLGRDRFVRHCSRGQLRSPSMTINSRSKKEQ